MKILTSEENNLSDIDPNHDSLLEDYHEPIGGYSSIGREMENSFLFNPIPNIDNATGDIPGSANYSYGNPIPCPDPQTMESTHYVQVVNADLDKGKRKREDTLEADEVGSIKVHIKETGEGSGSFADVNKV